MDQYGGQSGGYYPRPLDKKDLMIQEIHLAALRAMSPDEDIDEIMESERPRGASAPRRYVHEAPEDTGPVLYTSERKRGSSALSWPLSILAALLIIVAFYWVAVYSSIPFVKKWRDIYIETAMGTMTHQWLATAFIPEEVITEVMDVRSEIENDQMEIDTSWSIDSSAAGEKAAWTELHSEFLEVYPEIDAETFEAYMLSHDESETVDADGYLLIDAAGRNDADTGIRTVYGDRVMAIDTKNGIVIIKIKGSDYEGKLAIVKNPAQVCLALAPNIGSSGSKISAIAEDSGAVLAVNASGFADVDGHGNGGQPHGLVIKDGRRYSAWAGGNNKTIGFDYDNVLQIGKYRDGDHLRDAVEFKPVLVLDGEKAVSGSAGWGIQPRTAIGQTRDGQVLLLVVDGRQAGYSIGCTMGDLADVMSRYGAYQACNLDGGSSSIMYYNGREITKPSSADKDKGRRLPNAFVVLKG